MIKNVYVLAENGISNQLVEVTRKAGFNVTVLDLNKLPNALPDTDFILVDVGDDFTLAKKLMQAIDVILPQSAIFAVHDIMLDLSVLGSVTNNRGRIVGVRFISPEFIGKHVEITRTIDTQSHIYLETKIFLQSFTETVVEAPDMIGGIFYRMMPAMPNMASYMLMEGVKAEDIDNAMRFGCNYPMGPLHYADDFGLDRLLELLTRLYEECGDLAYKPSILLQNLVNAGHWGRKTGKGFFNYISTIKGGSISV